MSLFCTKTEGRNILDFVKLAAGYCLYVVPTGIIGFVFLLASSNTFVCTEMGAPFLLDNSLMPDFNMSELYKMRRNTCDSLGYCDNDRTELPMILFFRLAV